MRKKGPTHLGAKGQGCATVVHCLPQSCKSHARPRRDRVGDFKHDFVIGQGSYDPLADKVRADSSQCSGCSTQ
ncbi:hypothetical protein CEXT_60971 [Caerostris extrusa]|uniref:Uncharacterized protein n=1 Tax=Caerostris extrusa TaxID=172846 RepID=A0AAV4PJL8_CAEEX|nr:hypothetical protein CEXT_60971 [Caerostris extrusa]